jgi:hypothetical protein
VKRKIKLRVSIPSSPFHTSANSGKTQQNPRDILAKHSELLNLNNLTTLNLKGIKKEK